MEGPGPPFFSVTDGSSMAVGVGEFLKRGDTDFLLWDVFRVNTN